MMKNTFLILLEILGLLLGFYSFIENNLIFGIIAVIIIAGSFYSYNNLNILEPIKKLTVNQKVLKSEIDFLNRINKIENRLDKIENKK